MFFIILPLLVSCTVYKLSDDTSKPEDVSSDTSEIKRINIDANQWNLLLVNKDNRLGSDFKVDLETISKKYLVTDSANKFDSRALPFLLDMIDDAESDGIGVYITSAYRNYDYQVGLFNRKVSEFMDQGYNRNGAEQEASQYVALPGSSEHSTGLAVDIVSKDWYSYNDDLTTQFENTKEFKWLMEHAKDYGFILRYPKDKEDITKITYEPWHYRYVGVEHAREMDRLGITLEEYLGVY